MWGRLVGGVGLDGCNAEGLEERVASHRVIGHGATGWEEICRNGERKRGGQHKERDRRCRRGV